MHFSFDEDALKFAEAARAFGDDFVAPHAARWDRGEPIDREVYRKMGEMGLLSLRIPEEHGGLGAPFMTCGMCMYELGRADIGVAMMIENAVMWGELAHLVHPDVLAEWTPRIAGGAPFVFCLTEPGSGSDAASITTTARREGDEYVISGEKASVTHAGTGEVAIVFARTGGKGAKGISAFIVPWNSPGIEWRKYESVGERVTQRGQVFFNDVRVPARNLVGKENEGFREAMQFFDYNRAFLALACIGAAEKSLEELQEWISTRPAFGKTLAAFQGVTFPVTEHLTKLEAAKLLAFKVLWLKDQKIPHSKEAAMIKWYGIQEAFEALHTCVLLSGWPGFSSDLPHERRMRDVMGLEIGDGTAGVMKMVIAREVFGRAALAYGGS